MLHRFEDTIDTNAGFAAASVSAYTFQTRVIVFPLVDAAGALSFVLRAQMLHGLLGVGGKVQKPRFGGWTNLGPSESP